MDVYLMIVGDNVLTLYHVHVRYTDDAYKVIV